MTMHNIEELVVDEADMLCDTFYEKEVQEIVREIKKVRGPPRPPPQVVLVSATRTGAVQNFVKNLGIFAGLIVLSAAHSVSQWRLFPRTASKKD